MTDRDDFYRRLQGRVNLPALAGRCVAIVGIGSVGSELAVHLGRNCGVGCLLLIDGDPLELHNFTRHALPPRYLKANKADGMADFLAAVPGLDVGALNRNLDESFSDEELDSLLAPADLIVIATDDRRVQRRIAERALALDIPAVIPGLYRDGGGEVFVELGPAHPCFSCWDLFRPAESELRAVTAASADALGVIQQAVFLCLAVLDPESPEARDLAPPRDDPRPRQLFVLQRTQRLVRLAVERRPGCPSCRVGPSSVDSHTERGPLDDRELNELRVAGRRRIARDWEFRLRASPSPPEIEQLTVNSTLVVEGSTVVLRWATRNAAYVEIDGAGPFPTTGTAEFTVSTHRSFRLEARNPFGLTTAVSEPVRVIALPLPPMVTLPPLSVARFDDTADDNAAEGRAPIAIEAFTWPLFKVPSFRFPWPAVGAPRSLGERSADRGSRARRQRR